MMSEALGLCLNIFLDVLLILLLFINVEDLTVIIKLFTSLFILLISIVRTYFYIKDRRKDK